MTTPDQAIQEIAAHFKRYKINRAKWSEAHGVDVRSVTQVLSGRKEVTGVRGKNGVARDALLEWWFAGYTGRKR